MSYFIKSYLFHFFKMKDFLCILFCLIAVPVNGFLFLFVLSEGNVHLEIGFFSCFCKLTLPSSSQAGRSTSSFLEVEKSGGEQILCML